MSTQPADFDPFTEAPPCVRFKGKKCPPECEYGFNWVCPHSMARFHAEVGECPACGDAVTETDHRIMWHGDVYHWSCQSALDRRGTLTETEMEAIRSRRTLPVAQEPAEVPEQPPEREPGYYWVYEETLGLTAGYWVGNVWLLVGSSSTWRDDELLKIGRRCTLDRLP